MGHLAGLVDVGLAGAAAVAAAALDRPPHQGRNNRCSLGSFCID